MVILAEGVEILDIYSQSHVIIAAANVSDAGGEWLPNRVQIIVDNFASMHGVSHGMHPPGNGEERIAFAADVPVSQIVGSQFNSDRSGSSASIRVMVTVWG